MIKSVITTICAVVILAVGVVFENFFVQKQFVELQQNFTELYNLTENQSATADDVISVQTDWHDKKKYLHAFIPHNEIKEIDLWISETITLIKDKEWHDAISKIQVLLDLSREIPKTFLISFDNIL